MEQRGLVHIYCGDGKGKTSAAVGLAVRALGAGKTVLLVRFLKSAGSSELATLELLPGFQALPDPERLPFSFKMSDAEKDACRAECQDKFRRAADMAAGFGLVIFDEACGAMSLGFLDQAAVIDFIQRRPAGTELVFTGREPPAELIAAADYVSDIRKVKHPFDRGVPARRGIEI